MNKKTKFFSIFLMSMICLFGVVVVFITGKTDDISILEHKNTFVNIVALPDLAISTETSYIRHRSLSSIEMIFPDGPEHIEYFPSSFSISYKE